MDAATLAERDRRYELLDELMRREGLDAVLFTSSAQQGFAVAVKYLTGYPLTTRNDWAIKALGELPQIVLPIPGQQFHARRTGWLPPERIHTNPNLIAEVVTWLDSLESDSPRIGVYESDLWAAADAAVLRATTAEFIDVTDAFTAIRSIKSEWELERIRTASQIALGSFEASVPLMAAGRSEWEIMGAAEGYLRSHGAEETLMLCRSEQPHAFIAKATSRVLEADDMFLFSVEVGGPGGYWTQLIRPVFLAPDTQPGVRRLLDVSVEAIAAGLEKFRPGNVIGDITVAINAVAEARGTKIGHITGHGMGADLGDGVLIHAGNRTPIEPGMILTIHPSIISEDGQDGVLYGNTYLSTDGDPINLTAGYDDVVEIEELRQRVA